MNIMEDTGTLMVFMIASFALAIIVIWKRETIPERLRRPLALASTFMVGASFTMLVISLFRMG